MNQNILVAMDDSENALRAIDFIVKTFGTDHRVTLFSVLQNSAALCNMNSPELTPYFVSQQSNFCLLEDQKKKLLTTAAAQAKEQLVAAGFADRQITVKVEKSTKGIAADIVREAAAGYDLIVLGRRGVSGIKEFFLGSVAQKVLNLAKEASVLFVN